MIILATLLALAAPPAGEAQSASDAAMKDFLAHGMIGSPFLIRLGKDGEPSIKPGKTPPAGSFGGALEFDVATAGDYRIGLSEAAWIEVAQDGKVLRSIAHAHGEAGSLFRKLVTFHLEPGRYLLQVTGAASPMLQVGILPQ